MVYTVKYKNSNKIVSFSTFEEAFLYAKNILYDPSQKGLIIYENEKEIVKLGSQ